MRCQLLRFGWFPASVERPRTVTTFDTLSFFHLLTSQAKTTVYDFFEVLTRRLDNGGLGNTHVRPPFDASINKIDYIYRTATENS